MKQKLLNGLVHKIQADFREEISRNTKAAMAWNDVTPLARNEFLCWIENAKLIETRKRRIVRAVTELEEGKRRPCCWIGCTHRTDKQMSRSQKFVLGK